MVSGLIDIHTHIIPGVDDGARTVAESDEMFHLYEGAGFETIIATPHVEISSDGKYLDELDEGFLETSSRGSGAGINVLRGKELRLTPEIESLPLDIERMGLAGTKYVLVDFPSGSWPFYAEDSIFRLQTKGFVPVLAHPERYGWGSDHRDTPRDLVDRGVLIQVTLGSLVGAFGSQSRRTARDLLEGGLVHFMATDAHSPGSRLRAALQGIEWLQKEYGDAGVEKTLRLNPSFLLNEEKIEPFTGQRQRQWIGLDLRKLFNWGR